MGKRRMKKNGKKEAKRQAADMGLSWGIEGDDHDWDRLQVFLDKFSPASSVQPPGIGVYAYEITDVRPGADRVGSNSRQGYYDDVRALAEDLRQQVADGQIADEEELIEYIDQSADGTGWVIYTGQALATLVFSDNWLAIDEAADGGLVEFEQDQGNLAGLISRAAFFAYRQDVYDTLGDVEELFEDDDEYDED